MGMNEQMTEQLAHHDWVFDFSIRLTPEDISEYVVKKGVDITGEKEVFRERGPYCVNCHVFASDLYPTKDGGVAYCPSMRDYVSDN